MVFPWYCTPWTFSGWLIPLSVGCSLSSSWVWCVTGPPLLAICGELFTTLYLLTCAWLILAQQEAGAERVHTNVGLCVCEHAYVYVDYW